MVDAVCPKLGLENWLMTSTGVRAGGAIVFPGQIAVSVYRCMLDHVTTRSEGQNQISNHGQPSGVSTLRVARTMVYLWSDLTGFQAEPSRRRQTLRTCNMRLCSTTLTPTAINKQQTRFCVSLGSSDTGHGL